MRTVVGFLFFDRPNDEGDLPGLKAGQNQCWSVPQVTSTTQMSEELKRLVRETKRGTTPSNVPTDHAASPLSANLTIIKAHRQTRGEKDAPGSTEAEFLPGHCPRPLPPRDRKPELPHTHTPSSRPVNVWLHQDTALALSLPRDKVCGSKLCGVVNCSEVLPDIASTKKKHFMMTVMNKLDLFF